MRTRYIAADDVASVAQVHLDSWNTAYRGLVPDEFLAVFTFEKRKDLAIRALDDDAQDTVVIEDDEGIFGFVVFGASRDGDAEAGAVGEIWGIYIDPGDWRKGAGRMLAQYAQSALRERGFTAATLWVLEGNSDAREFYEKLGFRLDGARKTVELGSPLDAVRYRKRI
ncbi:MAG: GNAT family N-acetyltransferase [Phycisphaerae bacterium]|jgi:ribosomal protein S18 acetylase RimI-like enzyme|nr:GNAT family N-acetyltransferase [Phycisphaerae bacterium]